MKRSLVLFAVIMMFAAAAYSAEYASKDSMEFGGTASYSSISNDTAMSGTKIFDQTVSTLKLRPEAAYFIQDSIALGLRLTIEQESTTTNPGGKATTNTTGIEFAPAYVKKSGNMYPFGGLIIGMASVDFGGGNTISLTEYGLRGGVKYEIISGVLLNAGLAYVMDSGNAKFGATECTMSGGGFNLEIGFTFYK